MQLLLKEGTSVQSDYVILAPGNFPPTNLLELKGIAGYFPYPWPVDKILEADILQAKKGPIPTQAALLATDDIVGRIWDQLSPDAKQRFDCSYKTLWTVCRHPMPLVNAEKILYALKSGQLEVLFGFKCAGYAGKEKGFYVEMQSRYGLDYKLRIPVLINATGQGLAVTKFDDMLVRNLLAGGIIVPHQSGGIQVDFETSVVVHRNGVRSNRMFAVGEITRGVHFFTNAIRQNTRCADRITTSIVNSINNSTTG